MWRSIRKHPTGFLSRVLSVWRAGLSSSAPARPGCSAAYAGQKGYMPILLERGEDVDARTDRVARFWETGQLDPSSNVQFGEGGAGTFSDGKLNTLVKDPSGRNKEVLRILVEFGPTHPFYM